MKSKNNIDINQNNIANGIVHATKIFVIGDIIEICQKLVAIIGIVKIYADNVIERAFLISKVFGKNFKILSNVFLKYIIHSTAKKLKCNDTS